ncbi:MAG: hypothetical protein ACOCXX_05745, partial [Planctomycetota bacterium]
MSIDQGLEYHGVHRIVGPLVFVHAVHDVAYDEVVEIRDASGRSRFGQVLEVSDRQAVVQVLEETHGLTTAGTRVRFLGRSLDLKVSEAMVGRVFDGLGRPIDDREHWDKLAESD